MQTRRLIAVTVAWLMVLIPAPAGAQTAGTVTSEGRALLPEPRLLANAIAWIDEFSADDEDGPDEGFFPEFGQMITGAGWISAGPGYRRYFFEHNALLESSAAISWRAYKVAQARFEFPHLAAGRVTLGGKALWHDYTQVRYSGVGPDVGAEDVSDYRVQAFDAVTYGAVRPTHRFSVSGAIGWLSRPRLSSSTGPFDPEYPDTLQRFVTDPAANLARQPRFVHADLAAIYDTREHPSYPESGALYRLAWSVYRDQGAPGTFDFARVEAEAAQFVPVARGRGVLALRVWGVLSEVRSGHEVPFYLLPSLGGASTLRGYRDYRFHDRHMVVANLESRWKLFDHVDAAAFFDAGNVAARAGDLNFDKTSYGLGLRVHRSTSTLVRMDVARSREGWRVVFKLSDPLRLRHVSRVVAALPFVP